MAHRASRALKRRTVALAPFYGRFESLPAGIALLNPPVAEKATQAGCRDHLMIISGERCMLEIIFQTQDERFKIGPQENGHYPLPELDFRLKTKD